jgi:hypothetical protein
MLAGFGCVGRLRAKETGGGRLQGAERVTLLMMYSI